MLRILFLVACACAVHSLRMRREASELSLASTTTTSTTTAPPHHQTDEAVPEYVEALKNYTSFQYPIKNDLTNAHVNLQTILAVIDGIVSSLHGQHKDMKDYDLVYETKATKYYYAAQAHPAEAADRLNCIFQDAELSVQRIKVVIEKNHNVAFICKETPAICDRTIQAIVDATPEDSQLARSAKLLLALGKISGLYNSKYQSVLKAQDQPDRWEALSFVVASRDFLRPLVEAGVEVRHALGGHFNDACALTRIQPAK